MHHHNDGKCGICGVFFKKLGSDGFRVFLKHLRFHFDDHEEEMSPAGHARLQFPSSAYASGIKTPTISDKTSDDSLLIQCSSTQISERIIAAHSFHVSKEGRFDSVIVFCKESEDSDYVQLWFARVLAMVRVDLQRQAASFF